MVENIQNLVHSVPNIPELAQMDTKKLESISLSKVEWSVNTNQFQKPGLTSIQFYFSDGSSSIKFGQSSDSQKQSFLFED